jgi:hypothetical protein
VGLFPRHRKAAFATSDENNQSFLQEIKVGMDLLGHGYECFSESAWRACLRRAIEFGWEPEGTVAPTDWLGEWNGSYFSNDNDGDWLCRSLKFELLTCTQNRRRVDP